MKTALILGVNGQDGSYLAELLIAREYRTIGVGRQDCSRWVDAERFRYVALDLRDAAALEALLTELRPDEIYCMAAIHGAAGYAYETVWRDALAVNVGALHVCLEHMRTRAPHARLFYPSSLKAFGARPPACVSETTPRVSDCLYSITKNAAYDLVRYYRDHHGLWITVGYYFNHDSPRRPDSYFLPRLARRIAAQRRGDTDVPCLATLEFWADWGSSREFMELTAALLQADSPTDVVLATGQPVYAATLAAELADAAGLPASPVPQPSSGPPLRADLSRLRAVLGRVPQQRAFDVAAWILRERHGIRLAERVSAR